MAAHSMCFLNCFSSKLGSPLDPGHGTRMRTDRTYLFDVVILLLPRNVVEHRSLLVVYFVFIIVYQTTCPSGPPWNEGHRPNGSSRDQCL